MWYSRSAGWDDSDGLDGTSHANRLGGSGGLSRFESAGLDMDEKGVEWSGVWRRGEVMWGVRSWAGCGTRDAE